MLANSNAADMFDEKAPIIAAKRQIKLQAYRVIQQMSAFTSVEWPLAQILEDARSTSAFTDFEVVQAAYNAVGYLKIAQ